MKIRELTNKDLAIRVKWMNNPLIYNHMHFQIPVLEDKTEAWFNKNLANINRLDFAIEDKNQIIAMGGLTNIDSKIRKAELYIFTSPDLLGKGIGTMSTKLICYYGFRKLNLNKIYLFTDSSNKIAQNLYKKIGFDLVAELKEDCLNRENEYINRLYYELFRSKFKYDK